jgi:hypothetical protein
MTFKRSTLVLAAAVALAAWFAAAMSPGRPPAAPLTTAPAPADARSADLAAEITRLRERLRPQATPNAGTRNPFLFASRPPVVRDAAPPIVDLAPLAADPLPARPRLTLSGLAEDAGPDGPVRTAILSGGGQLLFVQIGDTVTDGDASYTVERIDADAVDLRDVRDGGLRRLTFR